MRTAFANKPFIVMRVISRGFDEERESKSDVVPHIALERFRAANTSTLPQLSADERQLVTHMSSYDTDILVMNNERNLSYLDKDGVLKEKDPQALSTLLQLEKRNPPLIVVHNAAKAFSYIKKAGLLDDRQIEALSDRIVDTKLLLATQGYQTTRLRKVVSTLSISLPQDKGQYEILDDLALTKHLWEMLSDKINNKESSPFFVPLLETQLQRHPLIKAVRLDLGRDAAELHLSAQNVNGLEVALHAKKGDELPEEAKLFHAWNKEQQFSKKESDVKIKIPTMHFDKTSMRLQLKLSTLVRHFHVNMPLLNMYEPSKGAARNVG